MSLDIEKNVMTLRVGVDDPWPSWEWYEWFHCDLVSLYCSSFLIVLLSRFLQIKNCEYGLPIYDNLWC